MSRYGCASRRARASWPPPARTWIAPGCGRGDRAPPGQLERQAAAPSATTDQRGTDDAFLLYATSGRRPSPLRVARAPGPRSAEESRPSRDQDWASSSPLCVRSCPPSLRHHQPRLAAPAPHRPDRSLRSGSPAPASARCGVLGRRQQLQLELEAWKEMLNLARASVEDSRRGLTLERLERPATLSARSAGIDQPGARGHRMQRQAAGAEEKAARSRAAFSDAETRLRTVREDRSRADDDRSQQEERRRASSPDAQSAAPDCPAP